jgi:hypothetical protein
VRRSAYVKEPVQADAMAENPGACWWNSGAYETGFWAARGDPVGGGAPPALVAGLLGPVGNSRKAGCKTSVGVEYICPSHLSGALCPFCHVFLRLHHAGRRVNTAPFQQPSPPEKTMMLLPTAMFCEPVQAEYPRLATCGFWKGSNTQTKDGGSNPSAPLIKQTVHS